MTLVENRNVANGNTGGELELRTRRGPGLWPVLRVSVSLL